MRRNIIPAHLAKKRRRVLVVRVILWTIFFATIVLGLWRLSHAQIFRIETIEVEGTMALSEAEIVDTAKKYLSGSFLFIFPKDNLLLYPRKEVKSEFINRYKRIKNVTLDTDLWHKINIDITERSPFAMWCGETEITTAEMYSNDCYFLDDSGYIFDRAPLFSGNVYIEYYGEVRGEVLGSFYLLPDRFQKIVSFVNGARSLGMDPVYVVRTKSDDFEMYLKEGGKIIFHDRDDLTRMLVNLSSLLDEYDLLNKAATSSLEYIDLRFGNKLYYKLKR